MTNSPLFESLARDAEELILTIRRQLLLRRYIEALEALDALDGGVTSEADAEAARVASEELAAFDAAHPNVVAAIDAERID